MDIQEADTIRSTCTVKFTTLTTAFVKLINTAQDGKLTKTTENYVHCDELKKV